jgi:hypothetical protein
MAQPAARALPSAAAGAVRGPPGPPRRSSSWPARPRSRPSWRPAARATTRKIEDTSDWFAQDRAGNVWYLGEATRGYRNGRLRSSGGSWEAGVDGAQAGVVVPAHPQPGLEYRQEYRKGRAEDAARVLDLDAQVDVPAGHFGGVLLTKEFTPIEPRALEMKFYAKGVGLVLSLDISGDSSREVLVSYRKGGG